MDSANFPVDPAWQNEFAVCEIQKRVLCVICQKVFLPPALDLIETHYKIFHTAFHAEFPLNTLDRHQEIFSLKLNIIEEIMKLKNMITYLRSSFNPSQSLSSLSPYSK